MDQQDTNTTPTGQEHSPTSKKRNLMQKLRHPFHYRFQFKIVPSKGGEKEAQDEVEAAEPKKVKAKKAKKPKAAKVKKEKTKKAKKEKPKKAKKEKAAKPKKPKKQKAPKEKEEGKKKFPLPILIGAVALVLGGATTAFILFSSGSSVDSRLAKAEKYVAQEKYDSAVKLYNELIAEEEIEEYAVVEAYLGLSDAYVGADDVDAAVMKLETGYTETGDERISDRLYQLAPEKEFPEEAEDQPGAASIQLPDNVPVTFGDNAFESMVRVALGKNSGEPIYQKDLDEVRSLRILGNTYADATLSRSSAGEDDSSGNDAVKLSPASIVCEHDSYSINGEVYTERGDIRSLDDLAYFRNLTKLSIGYNQISDISGIRGASSLNMVGLYANEITDLSALSDLTNLQYLYLYNNNIRDLTPVAQLPNLKQLLVQYNDISDLSPLEGMTGLKELFVSNNQISDLSPVSSMDNLEQLFVNNNQISDISPIRSLDHLKFFYAQNNQISDISVVAAMPALTDVDFSGNPVGDYSPASSIGNINKPLGRTQPY